MFFVMLEFSKNKSAAAEHMEGHKQWIQQGFDDGVFLMVGSLQPNLGGGVFAHNTVLPELEKRVGEDPFVAQDVVTAKIIEFSPSRTEDRMSFLLDQ